MKKIILTLCAGLFVTLLASANNADLFKYDANQVNQEMTQLQAIEDYVAANPDMTLSGMQAENNALVSHLNLSSGDFGGIGSLSGEPALGIPSFLWGCVFGVVGVAIVYFVSEDSDETKKAFLGCVVSAAAWILFYVLYAVWWSTVWW